MFFAIPTPPLTTMLPLETVVESLVFVTKSDPPIVKLPEVVIVGGMVLPVL